MRQFVITRAGLSAGRPGTEVFADQLGMTDDQLDAFVEAGWATEVHGHGSKPKGRHKAQDDTALDDMEDTRTVTELLELARALDIHGRSQMDRAELIAAIAEHE